MLNKPFIGKSVFLVGDILISGVFLLIFSLQLNMMLLSRLDYEFLKIFAIYSVITTALFLTYLSFLKGSNFFPKYTKIKFYIFKIFFLMALMIDSLLIGNIIVAKNWSNTINLYFYLIQAIFSLVIIIFCRKIK